MSMPESCQAGFTWERRDLEVNGIRTAVFESGSGTPVVFLHGVGSFSNHDWLGSLTARHRVIRPVHPGFGESADDTSIDSIQDYRLHYLDLFDALGLERFHLIGHSLGAYIAANFAVDHARRLESLVLVAPAGLHVPEHPTADLFRFRPEELLAALTSDRATLERAASASADVDTIVGQYREATSLARVYWQRSYDPKLSRWLHRVSAPTLLVWGDKDRIVPCAQAAAWMALLPAATLESVPGGGHLVLDENPAAGEVIASFLAGAGTAKGAEGAVSA